MSVSFKIVLWLSKMYLCNALLQSSCFKQRYLKHLRLEGFFPVTSCTDTGADLFLGTLEGRVAWLGVEIALRLVQCLTVARRRWLLRFFSCL